MFQLANPEDTGQGISFQGLLKTAKENVLPNGCIADTRWRALGGPGGRGGGGSAARGRRTPAGLLSRTRHSNAPGSGLRAQEVKKGMIFGIKRTPVSAELLLGGNMTTSAPSAKMSSLLYFKITPLTKNVCSNYGRNALIINTLVTENERSP